MRTYPRRSLAALTAGTLAVLAHQLVAGPPSVFTGPLWALGFWAAAVALGSLAVWPNAPVIYRAAVAAYAAVIMLARAAAFAWAAAGCECVTGVGAVNLGVGALTWTLIAANTSALLWAWEALALGNPAR